MLCRPFQVIGNKRNISRDFNSYRDVIIGGLVPDSASSGAAIWDESLDSITDESSQDITDE